MFMKDFHIHSCFSADSEAPMEDMIQAAIAAGLSEICFTEHIDFHHPDMEFLVDMPAYRKALESYRSQYAGQIRIHTGIELGIEPNNLEDSLAFYRQYRSVISFWIGSCHVFDGGDPYDRDFFSHMQANTVYRDYFEGVLYLVEKFPFADTYGHLDYVMRFDPSSEKYDIQKYSSQIDAILSAIIHQGRALELNTGSYRNGLNHPHPNWPVIHRYQALGGRKITTGSDAHTPKDVASHFSELYQAIHSLGLQIL